MLSVALRLPARLPADFVGHDLVYQQALVASAQRRSVPAKVLLPVASQLELDDSVTLVGDGTDSWVTGLRRELLRTKGAQTLVLFYEGNLELLRLVRRLAVQQPECVFIVNLFGRDEPVAVPSLSQRVFGSGLHLRRSTAWVSETAGPDASMADMPANLIVFADTQRRAVLARSLGLPEVRVWPLFSVVRPVDRGVPVVGREAIRVAVPVAGWQATRQVVHEISNVVALTEHYAAAHQRFEWCVFGGGYQQGWRSRARGRRMTRLRRLGVEVESAGLASDDYARAFADADIIWLPQRGLYTTQSSGKAADALVSGTPILAPNGSYPAQEMERWVPGAPAYTGVREAVELLLRADTLFTTLRQALVDRQEEIRWWYSPDRTVGVLLEAAAGCFHDARETEGSGPSPTGGQELIAPKLPSERAWKLSARLRHITQTRLGHLRASLIELSVRLRTAFRIR